MIGHPKQFCQGCTWGLCFSERFPGAGWRMGFWPPKGLDASWTADFGRFCPARVVGREFGVFSYAVTHSICLAKSCTHSDWWGWTRALIERNEEACQRSLD